MVLWHMIGLGVHGEIKKGGQACLPIALNQSRMQAPVRTVQAHLSVSLFPSVQYTEHIVSSLKLPETKASPIRVVCMCGSAMTCDRANQASTL